MKILKNAETCRCSTTGVTRVGESSAIQNLPLVMQTAPFWRTSVAMTISKAARAAVNVAMRTILTHDALTSSECEDKSTGKRTRRKCETQKQAQTVNYRTSRKSLGGLMAKPLMDQQSFASMAGRTTFNMAILESSQKANRITASLTPCASALE